MRWVVMFWMAMVCGLAQAQLPDGLYADVETSMGGFTCRLDYAEAPLTCANFVGLAEGSLSWIDPESGVVRNDPFYDGRIFHRVITNFMIQGGCPLGNGTSGPGYAFPDELSTNLTHHSAGILSMANSGLDSNGSQFFVTLVPTPWLDGKHAVFGEVVGGSNVVASIGLVPTTADRPDTNVVMNAVRILRVGAEAQAFDVSMQPLPEVTPLNLSLTNAPVGLQVVGATTNHAELRMYASTNLINWGLSEKIYEPIGVDDRAISISTNLPIQYFRAAGVHYPQAVTTFSDLEGRTLTFTQGANVFTFSPLVGGVGSCDIAGTSSKVTFWEEWTSEPYVGRVVFQPESINAFQFLLDQDGVCNGYQYSESGWSYIGIWEQGEL